MGEPLGDRREQPRLVGIERHREALARAHHVADQLGLFRADRLEPGRASDCRRAPRRRRSDRSACRAPRIRQAAPAARRSGEGEIVRCRQPCASLDCGTNERGSLDWPVRASGEQCHAGDGNETQGPRRQCADAARRLRPAAVVPARRQWLAGVAAGVRSAVQAVRGVRARASGFRHCRTTRRGSATSAIWRCTTSTSSTSSGRTRSIVVGQSLGGWAAAEAAVRNCSRIKTLSLLGPAGIRIKGMPSGDNFIWGPEEGIRNLYHNQAIPDQILAAPIDRRAGRHHADQPLRHHQVRLGAALVQPVAGTLAAPHHGADADHVGQGGQAVPQRLCEARGATAFPAAASRSCRTAATSRRSRSRRSRRRKSSAFTRGHADAVHILSSDAVSPDGHGRAAQAPRRLGGAAEQHVRSRRRAPTSTSPTSTSSSMPRSSASTSSRSTSTIRPPTA